MAKGGNIYYIIYYTSLVLERGVEMKHFISVLHGRSPAVADLDPCLRGEQFWRAAPKNFGAPP